MRFCGVEFLKVESHFISFLMSGGLQCDPPFVICHICMGQQQFFVQVGLLLALSSAHCPSCAVASVYPHSMEIRLLPR